MKARSWMMVVLGGVAALLMVYPTSAFAARRLLAYAEYSHVWVSQTDGHHAKRLGPAGDQTVLSPNGLKVASVREGTIHGYYDTYVAVFSTRGGAARHDLTAEYGPRVEPDGIIGFSADSRYLAVRTASDVVVLDAQTGAVLATFQNASGASWAPTRPDRLAFAAGHNSSLYVWSPYRSPRRIVAEDALDPVWGTHEIAFMRRGQIWTAKPNGSALRHVTHARIGQFATLVPEFWSPTGRDLVALYQIDGPGQHDCVVSLANGKQAPITVKDTYVTGAAGFNATGTRLLVGFGPSEYSPPGYAGRIVTMTPSGTEIRTLVKGGGEPSWNLGLSG